MNLAPNGEETRQVRRTEGQGQYISDSEFSGETRSHSVSVGIEPIRADRDNDPPRDLSKHGKRRETNVGKIVRQLIKEYRDQVALKRQEIDRLESKILEFEAIQQEVEEGIEENL